MMDSLNHNSGAIQVFLVAALVLATFVYVLLTRRMACEMRETRYDSLRPLINISLEGIGEPNISMALAIKEGEGPLSLRASMSNEGPGPALKLSYSIWDSQKQVAVPREQSILAVGGLVQAQELEVRRTDEVIAPNLAGIVVVGYEDLYGRRFESRLPIARDRGPQSVDIRGPLRQHQVLLGGMLSDA
jgi:hypothetical protein